VGNGVPTRRSTRPATKQTKSRVKPRSLALSDEDWARISDFGARRGLVSHSDAARVLLRTGLHTETVIDEIAAAHEWQIARAWQTALDSYGGKEPMGSWDRVQGALEQARARLRERERQTAS